VHFKGVSLQQSVTVHDSKGPEKMGQDSTSVEPGGVCWEQAVGAFLLEAGGNCWELLGSEDFLMIFQGFSTEPRPWSGASAGSGDGCGDSLAGAEGTDGNKAFPKRRDFWDFGLDFAAFSFLHRGKRV
jgi:hypothetical protein